jgi:hypothetical protein
MDAAAAILLSTRTSLTDVCVANRFRVILAILSSDNHYPLWYRSAFEFFPGASVVIPFDSTFLLYGFRCSTAFQRE